MRQRLVQVGMVESAPEIAGGELLASGYVRRGLAGGDEQPVGYGAVVKRALGAGREELFDLALNGAEPVNGGGVGFGGGGYVPLFAPVGMSHPVGALAVFVHPLGDPRERGGGHYGAGVSVGAGEHLSDSERAARAKRAVALDVDAVQRREGSGVHQRPDDGGLHGDVHALPFAARLAMPESRHRSGGGLGGGVQLGFAARSRGRGARSASPQT